MLVTITARHVEIPDTLRARAAELVERLAKFAHRPQRALVVFDTNHVQRLVEIHVFFPRGSAIVKAEAPDSQAALDFAAEKLKHQLEARAGRAAARRRRARKMVRQKGKS